MPRKDYARGALAVYKHHEIGLLLHGKTKSFYLGQWGNPCRVSRGAKKKKSPCIAIGKPKTHRQNYEKLLEWFGSQGIVGLQV